MRTDLWAYLHGQPTHSGSIKQFVEDFHVKEKLGYRPSGEGEHIYIWVRKQGLNTAFVAEHIAKFCRLPLRAVTYAGRKDKHAVTEQWFSVHKPGKTEYDWSELTLPGLEFLSSERHNKKLRTGVLKSNEFTLIIRNLTSTSGIEQRIQKIVEHGVPNYFGPQRFGSSLHHPHGGNLALAEKMLQGETIRNRNKRSMAISALRSWLFNEYVSERITQQKYTSAMAGDVCLLAGSNSFFNADDNDQDVAIRLLQKDISLSAPMWGEGELASTGEAKQFELSMAQRCKQQCSTLESLGLRQERRAIHLHPENLAWQITDNQLEIKFELPSGAFATSVIREIVNVSEFGEPHP